MTNGIACSNTIIKRTSNNTISPSFFSSITSLGLMDHYSAILELAGGFIHLFDKRETISRSENSLIEFKKRSNEIFCHNPYNVQLKQFPPREP